MVPGESLRDLPAVLLYVGPDQILPLTSVLGGVVGVVLMFWQRLTGIVRKAVQFFRRSEPSARG
jgi:hypothetical protein